MNKVAQILYYVSNLRLSNQITLQSGNSATLKNAIFDLYGRGEINIKGTIKIDEPIEIPERITLNFKGDGKLLCPELVTIYGRVKAPLKEIFTHKVAFKKGSEDKINAEWFGKGDYGIRTALYSANNTPVHLSTDTYMQNLAYFESNQTLIIKKGVTITIDNNFKNKVVFATKDDGKSRENISIIGGKIDGSLATDERYEAVYFKNVTNAYIEVLRCINVHITNSSDTGNIRLENCYDSTVKRVVVDGTNKLGVFILNGARNRVVWSSFENTKDSAIGVVNSPYTNTLYNRAIKTGVNIFGGASGMSLNAKHQNIHWNFVTGSDGETNGNAITVGHPGASGAYSTVSHNKVYNNTKGIYVQGGVDDPTIGVKVTHNTSNSNGNKSNLNTHPNSAGVAVSQAVLNTEIAYNILKGNIQGVSLNRDSKGAFVHNNTIEGSKRGVRNDAIGSKIEDNIYKDNDVDVLIQENAKQ